MIKYDALGHVRKKAADLETPGEEL